MSNKVFIQLKETSQALEHAYTNTYEKGSFYCIYNKDTEQVYKYPINNIWRVIEDYGSHSEDLGWWSNRCPDCNAIHPITDDCIIDAVCTDVEDPTIETDFTILVDEDNII